MINKEPLMHLAKSDYWKNFPPATARIRYDYNLTDLCFELIENSRLNSGLNTVSFQASMPEDPVFFSLKNGTITNWVNSHLSDMGEYELFAVILIAVLCPRESIYDKTKETVNSIVVTIIDNLVAIQNQEYTGEMFCDAVFNYPNTYQFMSFY